MLNGMGAPSGIDLGALIDSAAWLAGQLGKPLPALVGRAEPVYAQLSNLAK
jgi:(R)-citramalyl-CoA lyase